MDLLDTSHPSPAEADVAPPPGQDASRDAARDRRSHILSAFERCMVRAGFHRTTMQDVAREAGMSAGNLYRYFASKEAMVEGLFERDRERFQCEFEALERSPDFLAAFMELGRRHLVEEPREHCMQFIELWAEGTRNPAVAAIFLAKDREVRERMGACLERAKAGGTLPAGLDTASLVSVILALGDGLYRRRAVDPGFDAEAAMRIAFAVIDGIVKGAIDLPATPPATSPAPSPAPAR